MRFDTASLITHLQLGTCTLFSEKAEKEIIKASVQSSHFELNLGLVFTSSHGVLSKANEVRNQ